MPSTGALTQQAYDSRADPSSVLSVSYTASGITTYSSTGTGTTTSSGTVTGSTNDAVTTRSVSSVLLGATIVAALAAAGL